MAGFVLISSAAFAQGSMTVKGTVKDAKGEALVGAAVMLDGTSVGVVTDLDGKYTITFTPKAGKTPVLVFSSISYLTKEIKVSGQGVIDVVLEEDYEELDDVVERAGTSDHNAYSCIRSGTVGNDLHTCSLSLKKLVEGSTLIGPCLVHLHRGNGSPLPGIE